MNEATGFLGLWLYVAWIHIGASWQCGFWICEFDWWLLVVLWWFGPNEGEEKYIFLSLKSFISTKSNRVKKYDFLYLCYSQILRLQSFWLRRTSQRRNEPRNKLAQDDVLTCGQKLLLEFLGNGVPWTLNPSIYRVRKVLWWVLDMCGTSQKDWLRFQFKTLIKTSFGGRNAQ